MRNAHRRNTASHPLSTIRELAAWLQINPAALYRAAQTGKIPASKAGGRWWFSREAVEHWILDRMNAQTALIEELGPWLLDFSRRSAVSPAVERLPHFRSTDSASRSRAGSRRNQSS
jgi:excisionase family DNA binding protein